MFRGVSVRFTCLEKTFELPPLLRQSSHALPIVCICRNLSSAKSFLNVLYKIG